MEKIEIEVSKDLKATNQMLANLLEQQSKTITMLKHVILALVVSFTLIICAGIGGFFWYESQFEIVETETQGVELSTEGDNANINNVEGNQYNDSATHNE